MNWKTIELKNLCEVFQDGDWIESKDQSPSGIRLIQTGNVGVGYFRDKIDKSRFISTDTFTRLNCNEIFPNDCLISRLPDPVGRACLLPDIGSRMITAVDCTILRFDEKIIIPKFFIYYTQSNKYLFDVDKNTTGTTRKRISKNNLSKIKIPIPPLSEQQRIVEILDQFFAAIDQTIEITEKNLLNVKDLHAANLELIFSKPDLDWKKEKLGNICKLVRGPFGGSLKKSYFVDDGFAVYEQSHAISNQFEKIRYFINKYKFEEMKRFEIKPGDLIMSCSGTMGKVAIVPQNVKRGIINQALLKITPNGAVIDEFLKFWMESKDFQRKLDEFAMGAAIKNVASVKILKEILVPIPPIEKQRILIGKIKKMSEYTGKLINNYQNKHQYLQELKQSILHKALQGEL